MSILNEDGLSKDEFTRFKWDRIKNCELFFQITSKRMIEPVCKCDISPASVGLHCLMNDYGRISVFYQLIRLFVVLWHRKPI